MSVLPCGCDTESLWICEEHRPKTGTVQQFKDRLEHADAMDGTVASIRPENDSAWSDNASPAEQFRAAAVFTASAVLTRDDLLNRIATLEAELERERSRGAQRRHDSSYLLDMERYEHERTKADLAREREQLASDLRLVPHVAAILKAFYYAELSISSTQPLIALALELNPDLVERAR